MNRAGLIVKITTRPQLLHAIEEKYLCTFGSEVGSLNCAGVL